MARAAVNRRVMLALGLASMMAAACGEGTASDAGLTVTTSGEVLASSTTRSPTPSDIAPPASSSGSAAPTIDLAELPPGDASLSAPAAVATPEVVDPAAVAPPAPGLLLRYVVIPHPDDEFEAWSIISGDDRHYTVFVLLTRGEASKFCDGTGLGHPGGDQALVGERIPIPQQFLGRGDNCAAQRTDAWHAFLNDMAGTDRVLDLPRRLGTLRGEAPPGDASPSYELWTGPRTARFVFDLGDGNLTTDEVIWAVDTARSLRGTRLPDLVEDDIVAAAYYNESYPDAIVYEHPDHRAVQDAVFDHDFGTPGGQFGRTAPTDPDRAYTFSVPPPVYCAAMCVQPGPIDPAANERAFRVGYLQRNYGWLAEHYWAGALVARGSIFSQQQDFWVRY